MYRDILSAATKPLKSVQVSKSRIKNLTWLIVVASFAIVALGSAGALIIGMFVTAKTQQSEIVRGLFATSVGFLTGLIIPGPFNEQRTNDDSAQQ